MEQQVESFLSGSPYSGTVPLQLNKTELNFKLKIKKILQIKRKNINSLSQIN